MDKFVAYIDETGSFSYLDKSRNCFVAGWVCRWQKDLEKDLEDFFHRQVADFNKAKAHDLLRYPRDMHFIPLHIAPSLRRKVDRKIKAEPEDVPEFFNSLFCDLQGKVCFLFRSVGMPFLVPHEQAAYMEILRNTLVQLLDDSFFPDRFSMRVVIARRREKTLYGFRGIEDPAAYEQYLATTLQKELQRTFRPGFRPKLEVVFADARRNPGLILADFFCGAMKKTETGYLARSRMEIKRYPFASGYRRVGARLINQLEYLEEQDPVSAFMQGIQVCSIAPGAELFDFLRRLYRRIRAHERKQLFASLTTYLDILLVEKKERYSHLDEADAIISILQRLLPPRDEKMDVDELHIKAVLSLQALRIASHRGVVRTNLLEKHLAFLHRYGNLAFGNRLEYTQHVIDATLKGVQIQAFNSLQFAKVEPIIRPVRERYEEMFGNDFRTTTIIDENRAKLEGNYGQMCGFLYDLTGDKKYFSRAEESLQNDISACRPGSHAWIQGMGFLTVLYWKKGDLAKAVSQFFAETSTRNVARERIYQLSEFYLFDCGRNPFFLLHRLNICALARQQEMEISGLQAAGRELCKMNLGRYPLFLAAKWLAVLFLQTENPARALALLNAGLEAPGSRDFTVEFIRLPLKILRHLVCLQLGQESLFSIHDEINRLEHLQSGAGDILNQLGIEKYYEFSEAWDPYEIAALPPYYYA